jgi:drug/metabolite transporter (DMT)-like permease
MHELAIALAAGFLGMLGWGLADFFAKKTIDEVGDVVTLAWAHVFGTLVFFGVIFYQFIANEKVIFIPNDLQAWELLIFFGALQAIIYLLVYSGFSKGQVGVLSPIFASFSGFTAFISILFFGELINKFSFLGLAALFLGIILLNLDINSLRAKKIRFTKIAGLPQVLLATFLAIIWTLSWNRFVGEQDWKAYALFMYMFMTLTIVIYASWRKISLWKINSKAWKYLILIGFCEIVAYLGISWGYGTTRMTSIVALLSGAFSLPTILLARFFLKERITSVQIAGGLVIIGGIVLLSLL